MPVNSSRLLQVKSARNGVRPLPFDDLAAKCFPGFFVKPWTNDFDQFGQRAAVVLKVSYSLAVVYADPPDLRAICDLLAVPPGDPRWSLHAAPIAVLASDPPNP